MEQELKTKYLKEKAKMKIYNITRKKIFVS